MTIYYKATRPDGTDFRTGTVHYVPGETIDVGPRARQYKAECCTNTVLHASTVPTETLVGGSWPCRLFEVQGRPVASEGHKRGFRRLTVVREIDAHEALGPQGLHVAALICRASRLTLGEIDDLHATRGATWHAAWHAAVAAAVALLVRDQITKEDYDVLTLPWRSNIGRIHPDDAEVQE